MSEWQSLKDGKPTSAKVDIKLDDGSVIIAAIWSQKYNDFCWSASAGSSIYIRDFLVAYWRPSK